MGPSGEESYRSPQPQGNLVKVFPIEQGIGSRAKTASGQFRFEKAPLASHFLITKAPTNTNHSHNRTSASVFWRTS
ncbi:unnamed protein product [Dovyalis caffra]|uniref:Uncharacterized protein n=1 Tax=Dovyalis caffra TaxID=77055 RepID=A0AAV1QZJ9_9ROSI|nr:unnamed protein product [Dovyalis caffra]